MTKAILEFDLLDPESRDQYETMTHASNYCCALHEIHHVMREKWKYGELKGDAAELMEYLWHSFWDALDDHHIKDQF